MSEAESARYKDARHWILWVLVSISTFLIALLAIPTARLAQHKIQYFEMKEVSSITATAIASAHLFWLFSVLLSALAGGLLYRMRGKDPSSVLVLQLTLFLTGAALFAYGLIDPFASLTACGGPK